MAAPPPLAAVMVVALIWFIGCQPGRPPDALLPAADEGLAFFGPGRTRLDFNVLPVLRFRPSMWELEPGARRELPALVRSVERGQRVLLLGVGDEQVPAEHSRQQGVARALAVRRALIDLEADPGAFLIAGVAAHEADAITRTGWEGPRVECAVVKPASMNGSSDALPDSRLEDG